MRSSRPLTITLGKQQEGVDRRLRSGAYESASEIVRAALRALDREEAVLDDLMRQRVRASLADPRPDVPAEEVFARLKTYHESQGGSGDA